MVWYLLVMHLLNMVTRVRRVVTANAIRAGRWPGGMKSESQEMNTNIVAGKKVWAIWVASCRYIVKLMFGQLDLNLIILLPGV